MKSKIEMIQTNYCAHNILFQTNLALEIIIETTLTIETNIYVLTENV